MEINLAKLSKVKLLESSDPIDLKDVGFYKPPPPLPLHLAELNHDLEVRFVEC